MEWVETTAKTIEEAQEAALDQLGVGADEAEFDVLEEPKPGLFGRTRGQARIRARVMPSPARAKQERRRKPAGDKARSQSAGAKKSADKASKVSEAVSTKDGSNDSTEHDSAASMSEPTTRSRSNSRSSNSQEKKMSNEERPQSDVTPQEVGDAAVSFMNELVTAFGGVGTAELSVDGIELDVQVHGDDLGLLVGPGGRTLNAVQDLVRVAAQRRLGDHETRLRIDVAGYRERRSAALSKFAADVAGQVRESGSARSLEPMTSADRKVIHDALNDEDGVVSTSSGEDPYRRVVVEPA
jgi:spoIIIJ-associated protein|tara:strand:+ start:2185 stop:3075 length:891 start_codon:yes stop_codon:yes gene_type:complete